MNDPQPEGHMASYIGRRKFLATLGGAAAAWPLAARAQQSAMPVVGFLHPSSPEPFRVRAFRQGLKDAGFIEGENVAVEYRWADDQIDRLPALATELVQRRAAVIAAAGTPSILAVKAATTTTPIVFFVAEDPVRLGHVASLARPGGNLTGINVLAIELAAKRLELLRELVPSAVRIAVLVNPANATNTEPILRVVEPAARSMRLQLQVLNASAIREIDVLLLDTTSLSVYRAINGTLWRLRTGALWRDVPEKYGKWNSIYRRFRRWSACGVRESRLGRDNVFPTDSLNLRRIHHGLVQRCITGDKGGFVRRCGLRGHAETDRVAGLLVVRDQLKSCRVVTFPIPSLLVQRLQARIMPRPGSLHTRVSLVNLLK